MTEGFVSFLLGVAAGLATLVPLWVLLRRAAKGAEEWRDMVGLQAKAHLQVMDASRMREERLFKALAAALNKPDPFVQPTEEDRANPAIRRPWVAVQPYHFGPPVTKDPGHPDQQEAESEEK